MEACKIADALVKNLGVHLAVHLTQLEPTLTRGKRLSGIGACAVPDT